MERKRRQKGSENVKNERKRLRTSGLEYTTYRGELKSAKQPLQSVDCRCKLQCKSIPIQQIQRLFHDFHKISDPIKQKTYLLGLIQIGKINRRRNGKYDAPEHSRRQATIFYAVPNGQGEHIQVCRNTFSKVFSLSHKKVQVLINKKKSGSSIYEDTRGRANKPRKYTPEIEQMVIDHINSFPREENHYSRQKSQKEFLSPDLNINRMFIAFTKKYPDTPVNYRFYSDSFHKHFSYLRFGKPKSDTCSTCVLLNAKIKASTDETQRSFKNKLDLHQRKAERARQELKNDSIESQKPTADSLVISIDLEQVIFVPTLTHTDMFYSRQLSCYNLGIHLANTDSAFMCLWNESLTGRGGCEIGSAVLKLLLSENKFAPKPKLVIYSDNCTGQNKNRMLLMVLIYLVATGKFTQIDYKFLVSGHTYLPCDRDFAQVEKRKRVCKLFVMSDIEVMIKEARHKNPFDVINLEEADFKNLQEFADKFINTSNLQISQASWIRITTDNPGCVKVSIKTFNELENWAIYNVLKKGKCIQDICSYQILPLECKNRITATKLKDLKAMQDYIPLKHYNFYEDLIDKTSQLIGTT